MNTDTAHDTTSARFTASDIPSLELDARGLACPRPVVETLKKLDELEGAHQLVVLVDNDIAVQNLLKMAQAKKLQAHSTKRGDLDYSILIDIPAVWNQEKAQKKASDAQSSVTEQISQSKAQAVSVHSQDSDPVQLSVAPVIVFSASSMGRGDEELGRQLIHAFLYAVTQAEELPATLLFYNGGVKLTTEDSPALESLKELEEQGVEILSCGACLNYYGLSEELKVGAVTNMYEIYARMATAHHLLKPC